jgi:hypothetical protein
MFDIVAHNLGRDHGFFRDRNIAGAGRNHSNDSLAVAGAVALQDYRAGKLAIFDGADFLSHRRKLLLVGARGQDVAPMLCQTREDARYLRWSLAFSKDHFRHAGAQSPVVVDFCESQIFKWQMSQARHSVIGREFAFTHLLKKISDRFRVQEKFGNLPEITLAFGLLAWRCGPDISLCSLCPLWLDVGLRVGGSRQRA